MVRKNCQVILMVTSRDKVILRKLAGLDDISMSQVLRLLLRKEAKARGVIRRVK